MKKLMIAFAVVAVAAVSQAASFSWSSASKGYGIADVMAVVDNGSYAAGTNKMKGNGTWNYVLTIYVAGTSTAVDSFSGSLNLMGSGKIGLETSDSTTVADNTSYDYILKITGTQDALNDRGKGTTYDYTNAALAYEYAKGTLTTAAMGTTEITGIDAPSTWTVSGITKEEPGPGPEPVPEPTSGLLLLLGMAGLALRRKQK